MAKDDAFWLVAGVPCSGKSADERWRCEGVPANQLSKGGKRYGAVDCICTYTQTHTHANGDDSAKKKEKIKKR